MIKILLLAVVPFMTQHRNVVPKTEVSTNFYGSVTGIVDKAYIEARVGAGGGGGGCDTNAVDALANSAVVTNALTVATTNRIAALEPATNNLSSSKANKSALTAHTENTNNPHGVTAAQVGAVSTSPSPASDQTFDWSPSGVDGYIRLFGTYYKTGIGLGLWSGGGSLFNYHDDTSDIYQFQTGKSGTLALTSDIEDAVKDKVSSFESVGGASATIANGVAKLSDFFTASNSLLTATIDARLPYQLYAVPSTGLLKDSALNTTSLASVTVPDNFTDLLIRATVASSLSVTMPGAIATKYGDTFPGAAGEYLITITKTGAAEVYVRTIKLEVANA